MLKTRGQKPEISMTLEFFSFFFRSSVVGRSSDGRRTVVGRSSAAPVSSAAPKKKAFDRGGPVWPPRSNAKDDRLGGVWDGMVLPPQLKTDSPGFLKTKRKRTKAQTK